MRRISVRLLALCLAVMMLCVSLVACGKTLSGEYTCNMLGIVITYTFSGEKFTRTMSGLTEDDPGLTVSGTYRIEDGYIYLTSESGYEEKLTYSRSGSTVCIAEMEFVKK